MSKSKINIIAEEADKRAKAPKAQPKPEPKHHPKHRDAHGNCIECHQPIDDDAAQGFNEDV